MTPSSSPLDSALDLEPVTRDRGFYYVHHPLGPPHSTAVAVTDPA